MTKSKASKISKSSKASNPIKTDTISFLVKKVENTYYSNIAFFDKDLNKINKPTTFEMLVATLVLNGVESKELLNTDVLLAFNFFTDLNYSFDLFTCECGVPQCSGYYDLVEQKDDGNYITWKTNKKSYKHFEKNKFVFDKKEFLQAIKKLKEDVLKLEKTGCFFNDLHSEYNLYTVLDKLEEKYHFKYLGCNYNLEFYGKEWNLNKEEFEKIKKIKEKNVGIEHFILYCEEKDVENIKKDINEKKSILEEIKQIYHKANKVAEINAFLDQEFPSENEKKYQFQLKINDKHIQELLSKSQTVQLYNKEFKSYHSYSLFELLSFFYKDYYLLYQNEKEGIKERVVKILDCVKNKTSLNDLMLEYLGEEDEDNDIFLLDYNFFMNFKYVENESQEDKELFGLISDISIQKNIKNKQTEMFLFSKRKS